MLPRWPQAGHWPSPSLLWCLREYALRQVSAQTQWWYFGLPPLVPALHSDSGVHIRQPGLQLRAERRLWWSSFLGQENNFYPTYFLFCCPCKPLPSFMRGSDGSVFLVSAEELATSFSTLAQCDSLWSFCKHLRWQELKCLHSEQWFPARGLEPPRITYQLSYILDIYVLILNSSRIPAMK